GDGIRLADAVARHEGDLDRQEGRGAIDAHRLQAEDPLVRGVGNDDEVVLAEIEAAGGGALVEHADHLEALAADAHHLADWLDAVRFEEELVGRVAEHAPVLAVLDFGAVEEAAAEKRNARALLEVLRRAEHDEVLRFLRAVEDAPLRRRTAGAELD